MIIGTGQPQMASDRHDHYCDVCGTELRPTAVYCDACGEAVGAAAAPGAVAGRAAAGRRDMASGIQGGERKQVTLLMADVRDSMTLQSAVDPELWRSIMRRFFGLLSDGIHRYEGTVDKFTGDGVIALFGAPRAYEDHARRACLAALDLREQLRGFGLELEREHGLEFVVRMGINSGEVVAGTIGDEGNTSYTAIGHTVTLGLRMESIAEPGSVYLSGHTAALVSGYCELSALGALGPQEGEERIEVFELVGPGRARTRLERSRATGFSRFVGRDADVATLERAYARAMDGQGQVVGIVGEPGVGKSRLCHEFLESARARGAAVRESHASAHGKSTPFLPVLELLRNVLGITARDSEESARLKVEQELLWLDESFAEHLPLVWDFLGVADPERPAPRMDPEARQRALLQLLKRQVHSRSAHQLAVDAIEDLHWCDASSEQLIGGLVEALVGTRTLLIVTYRPGYEAPWMRKSYFRQLPLGPLDQGATGVLIDSLLGHKESLAGVAHAIARRSAGNPFFIEELVRSLAESGALAGEPGDRRLVQPVDERLLPSTVQAVLSARIDHLDADAKRLLQTAAVIGKEFREPLLRRVSAHDDEAFASAITKLIVGEFLRETAAPPDTEYTFLHPLTQEVAYGSQLSSQRAQIHAAVADATVELYPERLQEHAGLLAHHLQAAGETFAAARWSARAATWAGLSDPAEALRHWDLVRSLTDALPRTAETVGLGLAARIFALGYGWRTGSSEDEVAALFAETRELTVHAGDPAMQALVVAHYGVIRGFAGHGREFLRYCREAEQLARQAQQPGILQVTRLSLLAALTWAGRLSEALIVADEAIADAERDPLLGAGISVVSPYAACLTGRAALYTYLGRLADAERELERARAVARDQEDLEAEAWTHQYATMLAVYRGEPHAALEHARQPIEVAERFGGAWLRAGAHHWLCAAQLAGGRFELAIGAARHALALARAARTGLQAAPVTLAMLARGLAGCGELEQARAVSQEAVAAAREGGFEVHEISAQRTLAQVLLAGGGAREAQACEAALARALELIEQTGALVEEPLVRLVLAELAEARGEPEVGARERARARELLGQIGAEGQLASLASE